jgi:hypothetical protein
MADARAAAPVEGVEDEEAEEEGVESLGVKPDMFIRCGVGGGKEGRERVGGELSQIVFVVFHTAHKLAHLEASLEPVVRGQLVRPNRTAGATAVER